MELGDGRIMMRTLNESSSFLTSLAARLLLAAGIGLAGCGDGNEARTNAAKRKVPAVVVETVRKEPISRLLELTGETVAVESVVLSSTVEGPVRYCPWREGDRVEVNRDKPTRLIEIDRELYRAEVKAAEAALDVTEAKLEDMRAGTRPEEIAKAEEAVRQLEESATFARTDLDRIEKLVKSGSLPGEAREKARVVQITEETRLAAAGRNLEMLEAGYTRTAIAIQEALVKEAQAKLELAKARLNECVIHAPFSGTIMRVHIRSGDMAVLKAPLLEMADLSSITLRVAVPEAHATRVRVGMTAHVALDSFPEKRFTAKLSRVYPELDPRIRTRTVELMLTEPADLVPGMFARVRLVLESVPEAVTVSGEAVRLTPSGATTAYIIAGGTARIRMVETGIEQAGRVQILTGLERGEKVVITGQGMLKEGMEVRIVEPGMGSGRSDSDSSDPAADRDGAS